MTQFSRRNLLQSGLASAGLLATGSVQLLLASEAKPTATTPDLHDYLGYVREASPAYGAKLVTELPVTPSKCSGPISDPERPFAVR